ncbi:DUF368 domain-containing protein [Parendozoicomonas haliclonae]|uniref:DUF368 domain-containing protein n=1 Tax=Parendozoicomonas haliclonae TaxID=1960125 RepID=A0A1X7AJR8_9GAMM|nr:DUF368 domain-containing protein [Parendozoicomonas haliclonae]SMA42138.1 hypothetical protein EHSB41UT_01393 [Parendozoicomonas haliclonae]
MHLKSSLWLYGKGLAMGAADVVPGVSGGTIAFITGIYDQLLGSLKKCGPSALMVLFKQGPKAFWSHINGTFLLTLFAGVLTSIFSLARIITWLLATYPIQVWSFFFGLVLVSAWHMGQQIGRQWSVPAAVTLVAGVGIGWVLSSGLPVAITEIGLLSFFFAGALAICAMILPGISGSFILLLLGFYAPVMTAIKTFNLPVIALFGAGCVIGLLSFSHFLSWLLLKARVPTMGFLIGLMLGSLNKLWPWKEVLTTRVNSSGEVEPLLQANISPAAFETLYGMPAQTLSAVVCMIMAIVLVLGIDFIAARKA